MRGGTGKSARQDTNEFDDTARDIAVLDVIHHIILGTPILIEECAERLYTCRGL